MKVREDISVQDMNKDDAKMMYQAYRLGLLPEKWEPAEGMDVMEYLESLDDFIGSNYQFAWSVRDKEKTLVIFFGISWGGNSALIGDTIWNVKATPRNKYEATFAALEELRKSMVIFLRSEFEYKKFYERMIDGRLLRRVGNVYDVNGKDSRQAEYQTRRTWLVM